MAKTAKVTLRSRVPTLMKMHGMRTAADLSAVTGLGYATAYDLARGKLPSRATTIARLCEAFSCQPGDLYGTV
jgi:DNA-binding Xre family transcriptional regulator